MTTTFPASIDSYSTKVDGVTDVLAAHVNDLQDAIVAIETVVISKSPNPNIIYHTLSKDIWPEGTTHSDVTDDSYVAGLWNALWAGNAPDITGETSGIAGSKRILKCLIDTNGTQAGFVQFLSSEDTIPLRGKALSFSIDAVGSNVANLRCAILEWTSTADSITSDVVATWAAGNPTLATNWAYIGTPASQALSGTTRIKAENKTVGSTTNNLAVFVWTPDSENSADYFLLANAKLEIGSAATDFVADSHSEELAKVSSFYRKSYSGNTAPGTATETGAMEFQTRTAIAGSAAGTLRQSIKFFPSMRTTPTFTLYSSTSGTSNAVRNSSTGADRTGATAGTTSDSGMLEVAISNASANAINLDDIMRFQFVADARL